MDALKSLVSPLVNGSASSSVVDGMKLVVLGGTVETARRISSSAWSHFVNSFFLTAHFSEEDLPYDWLMLWLSRRPEWQRSREFETTTRAGPGGNTTSSYSSEDADWDAWESALSHEQRGNGEGSANEWSPEDEEGRPKTRVVFQPTYDTTHTIFYRGHWLRVRRGRRQESGCEMISISVVARNNAILKQLVLQAKKEYEAESVHRIQIYFADAHGSWRWTDSRHKRPMGSIVLNPGVKEMLLDDAKDFLKSEKWYADRGIPFRRGYLLHGVPGSGKSSLIHALAGQLQLDIYVVSLSASWISDNTLTNLMGRVPARCVLLLEDLDAAFMRSTTRDENEDPFGSSGGLSGGLTDAFGGRKDDNLFGSGSGKKKKYGRNDNLSDTNTLSLSGLLNALDGVAASEGRLLFATTNHLERLDPALSRPGRMDVWVEFKNASKWQAEALFRNFFPALEDDEDDSLSSGRMTPAELEMLSQLDRATHVQGQSGGPRRYVPNEEHFATSASPSSTSSSIWNMFGSSSSVTTPSPVSPSSKPSLAQFGASNTAYPAPPPSPGLSTGVHSLSKPSLDKRTLASLAKKFADSIPDEVFSVASLQGYLLKNKSAPQQAAYGAAAWVTSELAMRERLEKEKKEREVRLREKDKERRRKREVKEKEKKEKELKEKEKERVKKLLAEREEEEELEKMRAQLKEKEEARKKKLLGEDGEKKDEAKAEEKKDESKAEEKKADDAEAKPEDKKEDKPSTPPAATSSATPSTTATTTTTTTTTVASSSLLDDDSSDSDSSDSEGSDA